MSRTQRDAQQAADASHYEAYDCGCVMNLVFRFLRHLKLRQVSAIQTRQFLHGFSFRTINEANHGRLCLH